MNLQKAVRPTYLESPTFAVHHKDWFIYILVIAHDPILFFPLQPQEQQELDERDRSAAKVYTGSSMIAATFKSKGYHC